MYVVIAGAGRTSTTLALTLVTARHDVRLVEDRPDVLANVHRELPTEIVYVGNAVDPRTLELAGVATADVLVASMPTDAETLAVCFLARERFRVSRTIATIANPYNAWLFDGKFHVDVALNQADILASLIEQEMSLGDMMTLLKLRRGSYSLVSEKLPAGSAAIGKPIQALPFPRHSVICAVVRRGEIVIPRGPVVFQDGDEVLALVDADSMRDLAALFAPAGGKGSDEAGLDKR
jgi:trk system potassium uptake protein TrkA